MIPLKKNSPNKSEIYNSLKDIAKEYGTPLYVYDKNVITKEYKEYKKSFKSKSNQICYAVKANTNLTILGLLVELGSGFDIVSVGELKSVILAGGDPSKTIFSGVGKTVEEIAFALEAEIQAFSVESIEELLLIEKVAESLGVIAPVSIRFNPNVDAKTHPYISTGLRENKFGIDEENAVKAYTYISKSSFLKVFGINIHIGSQLNDINAFSEALLKQRNFVDRLEKELDITIKNINCGGGLGIPYKKPKEGYDLYSKKTWIKAIESFFSEDRWNIIIEPGRSIVGESGVLLTEVLYKKENYEHTFAVVDAAMNDYARVALYQSYNEIINLDKSEEEEKKHHIVGPVCESADTFAKDRNISLSVGNILAICDVGAYGMSLSSNYNMRARVPEVMWNSNDYTYKLIRRRESFEEMVKTELELETFSNTDNN